jgi:AcrR family transcriptional regulator
VVEPDRSARAPWGGLTRDAVVEKACELVLADGETELSIRALAAQLHVSPMALYRHVQSKEDLLDEVVNRLFAQSWRPRVPKADWRRWIIDAADRLHRFLVDRPAALQVYLQRPVVSSTAMERMRACLQVLRDGLGDDALAHSAYAAIQTYTIGFAALEAARATTGGGSAGAVGPSGDDTAREVAAFASPKQFRAGLDHLLDGVASRSQASR